MAHLLSLIFFAGGTLLLPRLIKFLLQELKAGNTRNTIFIDEGGEKRISHVIFCWEKKLSRNNLGEKRLKAIFYIWFEIETFLGFL